jgi:hypothetical protein
MQQCNTIAFGRICNVNYNFLLLLLGVILIASLSSNPAQAHVFLPDKTSSLLAIANQLRSELKLISNNLENSDNHLALKHLADITEIQSTKNIGSSFSIPYLDELRKLIESIPTNSAQQQSSSFINETINNSSRFLDKTIISGIDARDLRNSTIQALSIANLTDEILREYAMAHGIEPAVTNTSDCMGSLMSMNMNMQNTNSTVGSSSSSTNMDDNGMGQMETSMAPSPLSTSRITNISNYQNAKELAIRTFEIFRDELKPLELPNSTKTYLTNEIRYSSVSGLEEGLSLLLDSIKDKKPYSDIMQIIHGPIHTNLFLAYDLKMVGE